jgi:hypothetical protein
VIRSILLFLCAAVGGVGLIYFDGPGLARDITLRNDALTPAAQAAVTSAKCTTHWWVYSQCQVGYRVGQAQQPTLHYSFMGSAPRERFLLVRPASNPQVVIADVGLAHLGNRISVFVVGLILLAGVGFFSLRRIVEA